MLCKCGKLFSHNFKANLDIQLFFRVRQDSGSNQGAPTPGAAAPVQVRQERQEPLFHSVPPRPQRLLHSEAYIKYIEVR